MDTIIDFSEETRNNSIGTAVAEIVKNIFDLSGNNEVKSLNFGLSYRGNDIRIYFDKDKDEK
ncbi:MAG: hypothetical protein NC111_06625 [Bacteroides sp.]|nr:hypothetical protein [Bacteroides sp.]MCM1413079.1 hypothetical protein [Bacteroides sp.]MCM1472179.1 hypothetical protein [Bacteroides sp.]